MIEISRYFKLQDLEIELMQARINHKRIKSSLLVKQATNKTIKTNINESKIKLAQEENI